MPTILDKATARALVDKIKQGLDEIRDAIIQLWEGQGWVILGYSSWEDLCAAEFRMTLQFPRTVRIHVVTALTEHGMSSRAIGSALGVDQKTVINDRRQAGEEKSSPQVITGLDAKQYNIEPSPPRSRPVERLEWDGPSVKPGPKPWETVEQLARNLLDLLAREDASDDSIERRLLLGEVVAAIEERREHWPE